MRSDDLFARSVRAMGPVVMVASFLGCVYILGKQCLAYFRTGEWQPMGTLQTLGEIFDWPWATWPDSWFGLHRTLDFPNAGLSLLVVGWIVGGLMSAYED